MTTQSMGVTMRFMLALSSMRRSRMTNPKQNGSASGKKTVLFFIVFLAISLNGYSQLKISGIVSDDFQNPLPGVSILVKETSQGTISDLNGFYILENVPGNAILVFSFVGMVQMEVQVNNQTTINVTMSEDLVKLDELVVIGYGTQTKRFVTGSIASVDMEDTKSIIPNTNLAQSLTQIAGLQFTSSGRPGQGGSLLIRGQNSLRTSSDPLIVLDGIIFEGSLSDINPQDIKSVDVLKDAASTAIYGSRAANGVIMITSVRGKTSKPVIRVNTTTGISEAGKWMELQTAESYIQRRRDFHTQSNDGRDIEDLAALLEPEELENYNNGLFQDGFRDVIGRNGSLSTIDLSISGRTERTNYLISASNSNDVGLILGDRENRTTVRANIDTDINDWLTVGTASFFSLRDMSGQEASVYNAYRNSPFGTFYYPDGNVKFNPVSTEAASYNALYEYELTDNLESRKNLFSNLYANVEVPFIEGLSLRINFSPNFEWHNDYSFMNQDPYSATNNTYGSKYNSNTFRWVWENIMSYKKTISQDHEIDLTLMYGRNSYQNDVTYIEAKNFEINLLGFNNLALGSDYVVETPAKAKFGVSSMARLNYMFKKRYMLSMAIRRDGNSVFGAQNKFARFPSAAFSWIVSEESFMANADAISFLKFRVSYGSNGNEAIPPYKTQSLNETIRNVLGDGSGSSIAFVPLAYMGNESLKWEATYSTNIGLDFSMYNGRISGSVDAYNKTTTDLLVQRDIPPTNGYETTYENIGEVNNKGIELTLNSVNLQDSRFQWNTAFTFAYNKNKIVHLFGDVDGDGIEDDAEANSWFLGEDINSYFDYEFAGILQEEDAVLPARAGDIILRDMDGDTLITVDDRTIVGHGKHPHYVISLSNTFRYGNLSLFISVNSMLGWIAPFDLVYPYDKGRAFNTLQTEYWTAENRSNVYPSLIYSNKAHGNHYYISRDFVRIKDIAISYDFKNLKDPVFSHFQSLSVSLSIKNAYTFTRWLGPDPENAGDITSDQGSNAVYPMPRIYSLGLNMSF